MIIREIQEKDNKEVENLIRTCLIEFGANKPGCAWTDPDLGRFFQLYQKEKSKYYVVEENYKIVAGCGIGPVVTRESRRNSRKTTWLPRHRKMKPFPATAPQEKSHGRNWRSKGHLAPLMRPTKFPETPVSLERNTEVFRQPLL